MKTNQIIMLSCLGVLVLGLIFGLTSYNGLVSAEEQVNAQYAMVESKLQRRYDLIPNLVNSVKGYMKHEEAIFTEIAEARSKIGSAQTTNEKVEAGNQLEGALSRLLMVTENYPELKADTQVVALMDELSGTENRISVERDRYNEVVKTYNLSLRKFPKNIIANWFGFEPKAYFQSVEGAAQAPTVNFD